MDTNAEGIMASFEQRLLILCKTYPSPSGSHAETSCVAGMTEDGKLIRVFPVPFRAIGDDQQFKKYQWITARIEKAKGDHRPESHKIYVDTIAFDGLPLSTKDSWKYRRNQLDKLEIFTDFAELEKARVERGITLGLLKPSEIVGLDLTPVKNPQWTEQEKNKLEQFQRQAGLFDSNEAKDLTQLRKLPYDFHYRYAFKFGERKFEYRHKIVDWEAGALFWNCFSDKSDWERKFRQKLINDLGKKDLMLLMGTIHRFPNQWLIVSLIYPPMRPPDTLDQTELNFG